MDFGRIFVSKIHFHFHLFANLRLNENLQKPQFFLGFSIISCVPPCSFCARVLHFSLKKRSFGSLIVGCVWDYIFDRPNPPKSRPGAPNRAQERPNGAQKSILNLTRRLLGLQNRPLGLQNRHLGLQNRYLGLQNPPRCLQRQAC